MVSQATFAKFRAALDDSLVKHPDAVFAELARGWRAAQSAIVDWPRIEITISDRRDRWTLPWSAFPTSLQEDCNAWLDRLAGRDLFDEVPFRPVRPSTVRMREQQIRSFASALLLRGRDPSSITSLKDLVEIETFKEGLRFFIERRKGRITRPIYDLAAALKAIARHHLRLDRAQLDRMAAIIVRLDVKPPGLNEFNRSRLRQLDDPSNVDALLHLPQKLMGLAARHRNPRAGALLAQRAAAIEILLMAPLRLGNLTRLDLEQNLIRPGRGRELHIVIEAAEVKNREPLDYPLPPPSIALIEAYVKEFRPRLASPGCTALFPGRWGGPKGEDTLRGQITETVHAYTGMMMHPHLFRHAAAKLYLDANPGGHEIVRRVLGHRSIDTTTTYYSGLETAAAVRHYDTAILRRRKSRNGQ